METETDNEALEVLIALLIGVPLAILLSMYATLLITKIVEWYSIPLQLTFKQWFGIDSIISICLLGMKGKSQEKWYRAIFTSAFIITFLFGSLWIVSKML